MHTSIPPFGLLLDVDGPIASPVTRRLDIASIGTDLADMAARGVPIAFNTGRSLDFLAAQVVPALTAAGLSDDSRIFAVGEMGAVWASITAAGMTDEATDPSLVLPPAFTDVIRRITAERFADTMFFDETKHAMVSLEMRTDATRDDYLRAQAVADEVARAELMRLGLGVVWGDRTWPNDQGAVDVRIEPTIISTDIMSAMCGKALGADRATSLIGAAGSLPTLWYTVGDSRHDYQMADWLYEQGYQPVHVDVRPADGILERPYPIRTIGDLIHDEATAVLLRVLATGLQSTAS